DPAAADVLDLDLAHQLAADGMPGRVAAAAPPARPRLRELARRDRLDDRHQLARELAREPGRVADVADLAVGGVQAEDQGRHAVARLALPPADHHTVQRARAPDLDHADALALPVRGLLALGDHTLARLQPGRGMRDIVGLLDQLDRGGDQ